MNEYIARRSLNHASVQQDEENQLNEAVLINALRNGYMFAGGESECTINSYRQVCEKEERTFIVADDVDDKPGECCVDLAPADKVDPLAAAAVEAGGAVVEVDHSGGSLTVVADGDRIYDVTRALAQVVRPAAFAAPVMTEIVAKIADTNLTQRQVELLGRSFILGYLAVDPCLDYGGALDLYSASRLQRDRPTVLVMPQWGKRQTVVVSSMNRLAIRLATQSARDVGADVVVDAEAVGLMCAVADANRAETVAQAICAAWEAYEKQPRPGSQTDIEKQILQLAARR